jgi:nucleoside-diphosphate-sugar epimerase
MKKGKKVIIHGDGTSLWVMTNHRDFAKGFNGLLGNENALGEAFHITSDELLTWNRIYKLMAEELKIKPNFIHITSDVIAKYDKDMGPNLLGDKAHSVIFDNSKIRNLVPGFKAEIKFEDGVKEIISWYENNPEFQIVDEKLDKMMDRLVEDYSL